MVDERNVTSHCILQTNVFKRNRTLLVSIRIVLMGTRDKRKGMRVVSFSFTERDRKEIDTVTSSTG